MKFKESDSDGNEQNGQPSTTRMTFVQKQRPLENDTRVKSFDSNSEFEVTTLDDLLRIITKGGGRFQVEGKSY